MSDTIYRRVSIKAKGSDKVFAEGFDPGVLVYHDEKFEDQSPRQTALDLISISEALLEEFFETSVEEITEEQYIETKSQQELDKSEEG